MPDDFQRRMLGERLEAAIAAEPRWRALADRLLANGGQLIAVQNEPHLAQLLKRGRVWSAEASLFAPGDRSRCHSNVARRWVKDYRDRPATGWALSEDGIWRQHSWCVRPDRTLIETTAMRTVYYGFRLTRKEAMAMALAYDAL